MLLCSYWGNPMPCLISTLDLFAAPTCRDLAMKMDLFMNLQAINDKPSVSLFQVCEVFYAQHP